MAPKEAVDKIKLISTTGRGSQDHNSLLAAYKSFNKYLTNNKIECPVVILSDGYSSHFDYDVLKSFCKNIKCAYFLDDLIQLVSHNFKIKLTKVYILLIKMKSRLCSHHR